MAGGVFRLSTASMYPARNTRPSATVISTLSPVTRTAVTSNLAAAALRP